MGGRYSILLISLVCAILGFVLVIAFDNEVEGVEIGEITSVEKIEQLIKQRDALAKAKTEQDETIGRLQNSIAGFEQVAAERNSYVKLIQQELLSVRAFAGFVPLEGPGIEIVLNDRKRDSILFSNSSIYKYFIVHDSDLLNVINELRGAGAEAIAVNGTRIMANSRISCGGPTINVGKYGRFTPPFVIQAVGDPDRLAASFQQPDSIYHELIAWGLEFKIKKVDRIVIPRYLGDVELKYGNMN
ncbi:MAG TPA: DUF881 domain-containing protein [Candidatus Atribacteria bacterium]|nr:DUF881 domain-containing protein [Candidatus Atribacteria bacterium]HPT77718.1 DUF881 domain-containing protein [Candidatus Atribacteria bacterium]